ncbi:hypothetical protein TCAL_04371 [Tigriopus californicus]|uniref:Transient receptor ion channel domain-containing protein n=1 Tax=Tigriopus californicus TaxID=6832 RepID=A0A553NNL3_TIGCA|nr:hypothetical protein TCAL_04371 [Tigriopus californicus]
MTISKDPEKAQANGTVRAPSLKRSSRTNSHEFETVRPEQRVLTPDEKLYLLNVERGDVPNVKKTVAALRGKKNIFDINSVDPLGRSALIIAIENENLEMMQYLLEAGIETRDSLLVAIREDYVDGVDALLRHEEETHKSGTPYSWEQVDQVTANFTSDITPLILAAQRNNYEILKMLLDRGATIPMPHDVKCSCDDCVEESTVDSLRFSLSRINAYKALASPSLIALSSKDPILTAFELSNELKRLGSFVTHPSVQQLLAAIWYEGLPGFRRLHIIKQVTLVIKNACMFPIYSMFYVVAKNSSYGKFASKPFVKFINNSASYMFFLFLLALASQRADQITIDIIVLVIPGTEWLAEMKAGWIKHERGSLPTVIEMAVILWVNALLWKEIKAVFREGLLEYLSNMWNIADIASYGAFMNWIGLRVLSFIMVQKEVWEGKPADEIWIPRSQWGAFDPHLLSEGMFGAGMICSFLKLIHIFSINPYLGPLQVSLGKMVIDIAKWLVLYVLVLFSFGCGLNQLLWYYADLERQQCYSLPGGLPDFDENGDSCVMWRRFANLWETSQSLFWAGFGLVELGDFDLKGIKEFTRFWGLLMFGSYSVCNIIVLLNMLIAMMSNSYTIISSRSDIEWKFARSKLWISYFDEGGTVAAPFNLIPNTRTFKRFMFWKKRGCDLATADEKKKADNRYYGVVRCLVRRYITEEQRKSQDFNITEDDINEVRQDINSFRYELINILKMNDMKTPQMKNENTVMGRKSKDLERMIQKGFQMATPEAIMENAFSQHIGNKPKDEIDVCLKQLSSEQLVSYNPKLVDYTPATRIAYAKFKSRLDQIKEPDVEESTTKPDELEVATRITLENESISKMPAEPPKKPPRDPELVKASSPIKSATTKLENETLATSSSSAPDLVRKVEPMAQEEMIEPIQPEIIQVSPKQKIVKAEDVKVDPTESTSDLPAEVMVQTSPKKETSLLGNIEVEMVTLPKAEPLKVDQKNATPITLAQLDTAQAEGVESREEKEIAQEEPEEEEEEETRFDPKGKSISTGRNITGWI